MPTYHVEWAIDIEAENPEAAARKARDYQQWPRPNYWVGVFSVIEHDSGGEAVQIDLDEIDSAGAANMPPIPVPAVLGASLEQMRATRPVHSLDGEPLTDRKDL